MGLFSFVFKKRERNIFSFLQNIFSKDSGIKSLNELPISNYQDLLIKHIENGGVLKVKKIEDGILYLNDAIEETWEDKFSIVLLIKQIVEEKIEPQKAVANFWENITNGFSYKTLKNWKIAEKYITTDVFNRESVQNRAYIFQNVSNKTQEVFIVKLPNRIVQVPVLWVDEWQKSGVNLFEKLDEKREKTKDKLVEEGKINGSTKRLRRIERPIEDRQFALTMNPNLKDKKMLINDGDPPPDGEQNYTETLRVLGTYINSDPKL